MLAALALLPLAAVLPAQNLFTLSNWKPTSSHVKGFKVVQDKIYFEPYATSSVGYVGIEQAITAPEAGLYQVHFAYRPHLTADGFSTQIVIDGKRYGSTRASGSYSRHSETVTLTKGQHKIEFVSGTTNWPGQGLVLYEPVLRAVRAPTIDVYIEDGGNQLMGRCQLSSSEVAIVALGLTDPLAYRWKIPGIDGHLALQPHTLVFMLTRASDGPWSATPNIQTTPQFFWPSNYKPIYLQALSLRHGFGSVSWL